MFNYNLIAQELVSVKDVFNEINNYDTVTVQNYFLNGGDIDAQYTRRVSISQKKSKKILENLNI